MREIDRRSFELSELRRGRAGGVGDRIEVESSGAELGAGGHT